MTLARLKGPSHFHRLVNKNVVRFLFEKKISSTCLSPRSVLAHPLRFSPTHQTFSPSTPQPTILTSRSSPARVVHQIYSACRTLQLYQYRTKANIEKITQTPQTELSALNPCCRQDGLFSLQSLHLCSRIIFIALTNHTLFSRSLLLIFWIRRQLRKPWNTN